MLLVSGVGMLFVLHANYDTVAMRDVADAVTHAVDELAFPGETVVNFTFDRSEVGVYLPRLIRGIPYSMEFRVNGILLTRAGVTVFSRFSETVHLWNPGNTSQATPALVSVADRTVNNWTLLSGQDFGGVRRYVEGVGYMTFVFHPDTALMQEYVDTVLVPEVNEGETNPGTRTINIPGEYRVLVYPGVFVLEGATADTEGLAVRGFVKTEHLWAPAGDAYAGEELAANDAADPGPLLGNAFTVEWRIISRSDQPCSSCESGYRTSPEGFVYP